MPSVPSVPTADADPDQLLAEATATGRRLDSLERVLDTLLRHLEADGGRAAPAAAVSAAPDPTASAAGTLASAAVATVLGWASIAVGIASANRFDPVSTAAGVLVCVCLAVVISFLSASTRRRRPGRNKMPAAAAAAAVSSSTTTAVLQDPTVRSWLERVQTTLAATTASSSSSSSSSSPPPAAAITTAENPQDASPFAHVDALVKRYDRAEARDALEALPAALRSTCAYLWRDAELVLLESGAMDPKSAAYKAVCEKCMAIAERAYVLEPTNAKACEVLASALGLSQSFIADQREKLGCTWRMLDLCAEATSLDPSLPVPHHIVGRTYYTISNLGWLVRRGAGLLHARGLPECTFEMALAALRRAEELSRPRFWHMNELMKGRCAYAMGDYAAARASAEAVLAHSPSPKVYSKKFSEFFQARARSLLRKV